MNRKIIAGIRRDGRFSPNHVGNDAAIFGLTVRALRDMGYVVAEYGEADLAGGGVKEEFIFSMARSGEAVGRLKLLENEGRRVINSGYGSENCTRANMTRILVGNHIPHPVSLTVSTSRDPGRDLERAGVYDCWIKRGDIHAIHREDVAYARNPAEARGVLEEFAIRGIGEAVINEHLWGDLIKFYGVRGTGFFHWFYPLVAGHSKFGLEAVNGEARGITFDEAGLRDICEKAAGILNVSVYGGDCIVGEDGAARIIDFNDWPSFAPCRDEAAPFIAKCIHQRAYSLCKTTGETAV
ncbi:MAG: hypothetical protein LBI58_02685 [Tannerellaceae bacterium]|jgi:hypothetical protein|nr:hypothetical protein [Tannerellaceae bacterium]